MSSLIDRTIPRPRVRRRCNLHRKPQSRTLFRIWRVPLETGLDVYRELPDIGVHLADDGRPDREAARESWHRFGRRILAERHAGLVPPWALLEFGPPGDGR